MVKRVIYPTTDKYTLELSIPKNLIGKKVSVIYDEETVTETDDKVEKDTAAVDAFYESINLDLSNYKFNREEANER